MKKGRKIRTANLCSGILMLLTLAWLTVSLPYIYEGQQKQPAAQKIQDRETADDNSNPLSGTTEEKTKSTNNTLAEYLHDTLSLEEHYIIVRSFFNHHSCDVYLSFHPEKVSPPPKA
jgi:hypothetical protein